ncbi:MAG TPA: tetratricopeptide repeat protein [Gemmatimonadales bacterium]|nr:tetratricopeptide repeat protein [Gemmatimonadales bacterium]
MTRRNLLAPLALLALSGCAYYNGMYNTRKFTNQAEKAEREGRTIDASTAWGQVTVKAETLLVRHPDSKYAPEARVLMGRAYAKLGDCTSARASLEPGLGMIQDSVLERQGRLALARCLVTLGEAQRAVASYQRLYQSASDSQRVVLRPELLTALQRAGAWNDALQLASDTTGATRRMRLLLLAGAGRHDQVVALADSLAAEGDTLAPWDSASAVAGRTDPATASRVVDAMLRLPSISAERRARVLLADAARLAPLDSGPPMARLRQVLATAAPGDLTARARLEMVRLRLRYADSLADLDAIASDLKRETEDSPLAAEARTLAGSLDQLIGLRDSVNATTPTGDMRTFLAAEVARDELQAPPLARQLFVRVADLWPTSPYAAKALLAARVMAPADSTLRIRIETEYTADPYVMAVRGEDVPALRSLEDSLGNFASAELTRRVRETQRPRPAPATRPGQRPAPGQRVPEPR